MSVVRVLQHSIAEASRAAGDQKVLSLKIVSAMMASLYVKRRRAQVSFIIFIILP